MRKKSTLSAEQKLSSSLEFSCEIMPDLRMFKGSLSIIQDSGTMGFCSPSRIYVSNLAVDLCYDLCTKVPKNARGVVIFFAHEIAHIVADANRTYPYDLKGRSMKEAVAEIFSARECLSNDLIEGLAVFVMYRHRSDAKTGKKQDRNESVEEVLFNAMFSEWTKPEFYNKLERSCADPRVLGILERFRSDKLLRYEGDKTELILSLVEKRVLNIESSLAEATQDHKQLYLPFLRSS